MISAKWKPDTNAANDQDLDIGTDQNYLSSNYLKEWHREKNVEFTTTETTVAGTLQIVIKDTGGMRSKVKDFAQLQIMVESTDVGS